MPSVFLAVILLAIAAEDVLKKEGFADPQSMKARLEEEGILIPLYSRETGLRSGMYSYAPLQKQADLLRGKAKDLYKRNGFELPEDLVQKAIDARGDKLVREALHYAARPQGFKVIEAEDNGHKTTFMGSVKDMYKKAGYEVVPVARNNQGKNHNTNQVNIWRLFNRKNRCFKRIFSFIVVTCCNSSFFQN
mgnify:CR=1 FL=1